MREVAVQAANDTNNAQDRGNLQTEMDAMIKEIDRIAATTTWAGTNLMADTAKSFEFQVGAATGAANQIKITIDGMSSAELSLDGSKGIAASDFSFSTHTNTGGAAVDSLVLTKTDTDSATDVTDVFDLKHTASQATNVAATLTLFGDTVTLTGSAQGDQKLINDAFGHHGVAAAIKTSYDTGTNAAIAGTENVAYLTLTVPEAGSGGKISVEATTTGGTDADTNARAAIDKIDTAIKDVNIQRSELGAVSNRLNHTVNNLTNISSNLSAAKGGIEDADFALETTNLAKNQILQQASTAMLAQANASQAKRSQPAARLSVTQRFVARRSTTTGPHHAGLFCFRRRLRNGVFVFHDLSRRVFQSAAISAGGLALSVCVMRLLGFVCLR